MTRVKTKRNPNGLKIGDVIKPIKSRIKSNDYNITEIIKCKILDYSFNGYSCHTTIKIEILEGFCRRGGIRYVKSSRLFVFCDAFELCNTTDEYEIF